MDRKGGWGYRGELMPDKFSGEGSSMSTSRQRQRQAESPFTGNMHHGNKTSSTCMPTRIALHAHHVTCYPYNPSLPVHSKTNNSDFKLVTHSKPQQRHPVLGQSNTGHNFHKLQKLPKTTPRAVSDCSACAQCATTLCRIQILRYASASTRTTRCGREKVCMLLPLPCDQQQLPHATMP